MADDVLETPLGILRYFKARKVITAQCLNPAHGDCRMQRTVLKGKSGNKLARGRCLGMLYAFLEAAFHAGCGTRKDHKKIKPTYLERRDARTRFMLLDGSDRFASVERKQAVGEINLEHLI